MTFNTSRARYITDTYLGSEAKFNTKTFNHPLDHFLNSSSLIGKMENLVLLYLDFDQQEYKSTEKRIRVSFTEKVGFIGGTFGLFTGFSLPLVIDIGKGLYLTITVALANMKF